MPAAPLPVIARLTSDGARASTRHPELARGEVDDAPGVAHQDGRARELVLGVDSVRCTPRHLPGSPLGVDPVALAPSEVKRAMTGNGAQPARVRCSARSSPCRLPAAPLARGRCGWQLRGWRASRAGCPQRHWFTSLALILRGPRNGPALPTPTHPVADHRTTVIASLRGKLQRELNDRVVVEAAGVGYEGLVRRDPAGAGSAKAADGDTATPPGTSRPVLIASPQSSTGSSSRSSSP